MAEQPAPRPDDPSVFFPDGRADRPLVSGTVARGNLRTDVHLFTGKRSSESAMLSDATLLVGASGNALNGLTLAGYRMPAETGYVDSFPFPVTQTVLQHGRNRFMIYCVVCHDALGTGHGMIVERGYTQPPSYHIERLRKAPAGYFFDVITNGYGSMPSHKQQVPPRDRWAIAAYIRVLQLSQHFPVRELAGDMKEEWRKTGGKGP
jgi:hypothetical protein